MTFYIFRVSLYIKPLYWNIAGNTYLFNGKSFAEWQKTGHDTHSYIAHPYFTDAQNFDFSFKKKKNIKRIGFVPFDYSQAGIYCEKEWLEKAKLPASTLKAFDKAVEINLQKNTKRDE